MSRIRSGPDNSPVTACLSWTLQVPTSVRHIVWCPYQGKIFQKRKSELDCAFPTSIRMTNCLWYRLRRAYNDAVYHQPSSTKTWYSVALRSKSFLLLPSVYLFGKIDRYEQHHCDPNLHLNNNLMQWWTCDPSARFLNSPRVTHAGSLRAIHDLSVTKFVFVATLEWACIHELLFLVDGVRQSTWRLARTVSLQVWPHRYGLTNNQTQWLWGRSILCSRRLLLRVFEKKVF